METMSATATAVDATKAAAPAAAKAPRSVGIKLTAGDQELVLTARVTKAGASSDITHYRAKAVKGGAKRQGERGATTEHANLAAARAHIEKVATGLVKQGWQRPVRAAGYVRKPDAFGLNNLPKAPKK